jgi:hypothetical protein
VLIVIHGGGGTISIERVSSNVLTKSFNWSWTSHKRISSSLSFLLLWSQRPVLSWLRVDVLIIIHTSGKWIVVKSIFLGSVVMMVMSRLMKTVWGVLFNGSHDLFTSSWWGISNSDWSLLVFSRLGINPSVIVHRGGKWIVVKSISSVSEGLS